VVGIFRCGAEILEGRMPTAKMKKATWPGFLRILGVRVGGGAAWQALIAKILNDKKYFNTGEKCQGNSVFQGKLLKIPE